MTDPTAADSPDDSAKAQSIRTPLYRRLVLLEVLADEDPSDWEVGDIAHEIVDGGASGHILMDKTDEVSPDLMAQLLAAQGSDPDFLVHPQARSVTLSYEGRTLTIGLGPGDERSDEQVVRDVLEHVAVDVNESEY